ncbi:hypothetical protein TALK_06150 [Thalassospira alkalitolerans]|uniref:Uncharacterized protein n=1 Tax=Thalassospira alkalitolerans TaxID=1293890 RepID=A0A1Y2LDU1_9PROT|nr:hypothetical protein TALK_06150 [Thalassospira alkalitolerans]
MPTNRGNERLRGWQAAVWARYLCYSFCNRDIGPRDVGAKNAGLIARKTDCAKQSNSLKYKGF